VQTAGARLDTVITRARAIASALFFRAGEPLASRVDRWLQRYLWVVIVGLATACTLNVLTASRAKPFWHDEIYTILMSRLPSLQEMWRAGLAGVDLSPPLNLWLTRAIHSAAGVGPVATRVPALLGFALTVFVVFVTLLRRAGPTAALTGALVPFFTAGLRYGSEARGYGMMMGLAAVAIYCWMEAAQGRRRSCNLVLLSAALAASVWNHYFGVLAFAPVIVGELSRGVQTRRIDGGVAAAVIVACLAAVPLYPLAAASAGQRSTFWSNATPGQFVEVYAFVLNALISTPFAIAGMAGAGFLIAGMAGKPPPATCAAARDVPERRLPRHETMALFAAVMTPFLAVLLGGLTTVFAPRYALSSVAGVSLALPLVVWRLNVRDTLAQLALCAVLLYFVATSVVASLGRFDATYPNPTAERTLLTESLRSPSPTVVASSLQFLQFWYYVPAGLKARMWYVADPAEAVERTGSDTFDRGYLALARWTSVPVLNYDTFIAAHRSFRVYQAGSGWLLEKLAEDGATVEEIGVERGGRLYRVTMPSAPDGSPPRAASINR
jgi:hypothetical protein